MIRIPLPFSRRTTALAAGLVVAGAATVTTLWLVSPSSAHPASSPPASKASLPGQGAELVALIDGGKSRTYVARYRTVSGAGATHQDITMEVSQQAPRKREDVTITASGRTAKSETFLLPDHTVSCQAEGGGPWTCANGPAGAVSSGFDELTTQIAKLGATSITRGADETIAGVSARCYRIQAAQKVNADVCTTPDGIPAKVEIGPSKFELVKLESTVADSAFTPPV